MERDTSDRDEMGLRRAGTGTGWDTPDWDGLGWTGMGSDWDRLEWIGMDRDKVRAKVRPGGDTGTGTGRDGP